MKALRKQLIMAVLSVLVIGGLTSLAAAKKQDKRPLVQMAILLDTSGSMDGLIEQAKSQLWKIVNELIASKKNGQSPNIEVALYEYGKDSISAKEGYIRQIVPLTTDLDKVSEELFALRTNGGSEFCGQVIQKATLELAWSKSNADLKLIFIAGNEPFTQGPVKFQDSCKAAITKGIVVNTIHCGSYQDGVSGKWKAASLLADGSYLNIDQNRKVQHIAAPQDQEIAKLGQELNKTYIAFGRKGAKAKKRQAKQDMNATSAAAGSMTQRAVFKSSANYSNAEWDMVDAVKEGKVKLEEVEEEAMPAEMQKMDDKEREKYLQENSKKRAKIQEKIRKLNAERKKYVTEKRKELSKSGEDTLDAAMIKSIRKQATKKNFKF
jgi:hypothetical protein